MDANCTMNHEIVPKSIDRLRRAQNVSAQHKTNHEYAKYAKSAKYAKIFICKICIICLKCRI